MTLNTYLSQRRTPIAISLAGLLGVVLLLYLRTIHWPFSIIDSPILLAQAISFSPVEYLTSPAKYQFLTFNNFTPWVTLSWDIDYNLFQLEALGFRLHHLASLSVLTGLVFLLLYRLTRSVANACIFSLAMITLPATFAVADDLVNRHYLEGMIFSLLSFYFAGSYRATPKPLWLALSVLFYGLSITAKEVYIPLPGILFFFYSESLKRRIVLMLPYGLTLVGYLAWRFYMLGGGGGYSPPEASINLLDNTDLLLQLGALLVTSLFVNPPVSALLLALFIVMLATGIRKLQPAAKMGIVVGASCLLLPLMALLPLLSVGIFSHRWLFAPSLALVLLFGYLCAINGSKVLTRAVYLVVLSCSLLALVDRVQEPTPNYVKGNGKIYKGILESDPSLYIRIPGYSRFAAQGFATWVHIAKLHNGAWGTLPVFDAGQLRYHDMDEKKEVFLGRKSKTPVPLQRSETPGLELVKDSGFDPQTGDLAFNFIDSLHSRHCYVYVFGEHNGMLFGNEDCDQWRIQYRELRYLLKMAGYDLEKTSLAVWSGQADEALYSRPYTFAELIDMNAS